MALEGHSPPPPLLRLGLSELPQRVTWVVADVVVAQEAHLFRFAALVQEHAPQI